MKKLIMCFALALWAPLAFALSPYIAADRVAAGEPTAVMAQIEKKLQAEGFQVVGRHLPKGLPQYGVVIVTYKPILDAIARMGGANIVGAGIRVGVKSDGSVSYMNPEYWYRAFFRKGYASSEEAVKDTQDKLTKALGPGKPFGGEEPASDLLNYRYMIGMEKFDSDKNELNSFSSFDQAVKTVQTNLADKTNNTAKVYEIIMPDKKLAVFGVALNDPKRGEGWWVKRIGADHIAAMPYEMYIVGNKVYALYGRFRTALAWPDLGMGTFMSISDMPDATLEALTGVAGGTYEKSSAF